jgi:multidrug resistance protein, MATE family
MLQRIINRWREPGGYREILVMALPLILSTGSWSVFMFVSRMFLSWYSPEALAASVPASIMEYTVVSLFQGTASYAGTFVAQYYGARQNDRIGPVIWQGLCVALIGGALILTLYPISPWLFRIIGHAPAVRANECVYFQILCLAGFPAIANTVLSAFFSGLGRTLPVMAVNVAGMLINLIFCYLLIFGKFGFPEMGMAGAGWAAVIASYSGLLIYCLLVFTKTHEREFKLLGRRRLEPALFARLLRFGVPSGLHLVADAAGFTLFLLFIGRLGVVPLAATNIAFNINTFAFMPMLGLGTAVSVLMGQYLGRERPDLASRAVYSAFHMVFVYMTLVAATYVLVPDLFIYPYAAKADPSVFPAIRGMARILLCFVAFYSLFD